MWLLFLALHLVGLTGYNLVLRKSLVGNVDRWTLATVMQTAIALPMVVALVIAPPPLSLYTWPRILLVAVTALLALALHIANVKALQHLEASVYSILYNLRIPLTTVLGILFLQESPTALQVAGGLLIFLAVTLVRQKGSKATTGTGVLWGIAAAVIISLLNFGEKKLIAEVGYLNYAIPVMLLASLFMVLITVLRKQKVDFDAFKQPQTVALMGLRALSAYGFTLAFNAGGILSVSSYISSMSVIITVALGVLVLNERDWLKQKALATLIAVIGLTAILIANL